MAATVIFPGDERSREICNDSTWTTTWARDSHELFDYEARHVHKKTYFLRKPARVFRTSQDVQVVPEGAPLPLQAAEFLLSLRQREGRFHVVPAEKSVQATPTTSICTKKVWLIVKDLPCGNHQLLENDVIKLGRFKLRVKQLVRSGSIVPELRLDDVETPHSFVTPEESRCMQCRICLLEGGTEEDPLVCPCQCKGSIKFVHLDCLRHWINGRLFLVDEQSQKTSFFFKQLQCELCKTNFPSTLIFNNEKISVVNIPKIEAPFIILENIVGTANRGLHIISMEAKKELKLGRGHESDVRIGDVSISRYHATIRFSNGEFILEDHNSKFGTLVYLRKNQPIDSTCPVSVQVGRTVLNLSLRHPPRFFEEILAVDDEDQLPTSEIDKVNPSEPTAAVLTSSSYYPANCLNGEASQANDPPPNSAANNCLRRAYFAALESLTEDLPQQSLKGLCSHFSSESHEKEYKAHQGPPQFLEDDGDWSISNPSPDARPKEIDPVTIPGINSSSPHNDIHCNDKGAKLPSECQFKSINIEHLRSKLEYLNRIIQKRHDQVFSNKVKDQQFQSIQLQSLSEKNILDLNLRGDPQSVRNLYAVAEVRDTDKTVKETTGILGDADESAASVSTVQLDLSNLSNENPGQNYQSRALLNTEPIMKSTMPLASQCEQECSKFALLGSSPECAKKPLALTETVKRFVNSHCPMDVFVSDHPLNE